MYQQRGHCKHVKNHHGFSKSITFLSSRAESCKGRLVDGVDRLATKLIMAADSINYGVYCTGGYRFLILFFNCMLTFGSYFCFDMPSVLQDKFQGNSSCNGSSVVENGTSCCQDCLGMSPQQYNLLYAIYAWTNAAIVIIAGFLIDKLGNRVGVFTFSFLCLIGSATFAAGTFLRNTSAMLPIMLLGRLLFGSGNGSLSIVQNRITAFWFRDKELAMAFGFTLAFSRLGSVLNFLVTVHFEEHFGLTWTLWGGAILCAIGFVSAIIVGLLDKFGVEQLGQTESLQQDSKKVKLTDVKHFNLLFWLLAFTIMFFYDGVFPFVADASKFIQDKYGYPSTVSGYIAGSVYYSSMVLSPFLGFIIDIIGKRGILALICALLTLPVFILLAFTEVYPLVATLALGVTYSFAAASMWPSIPLVVHQSTIGTAMGLTTSLQMIGIGVSNLCVGAILGKDSYESLDRSTKMLHWKYVMVFLLANTVLCVTTASLLNLFDRKRGGILNESRRQKTERLAEASDNVPQLAVDTSPQEEPSEHDPLLQSGEHRSRSSRSVNC